MKITVENADTKNLEELWKIERECFTTEAYTKYQIEMLLKQPHAIGMLARIDDEVVGFIIGAIEKYGRIKAGHVYTIDVAVKHRRRGVGLKLLNEIEEIFLKKGAEFSYLEVRVNNEAARALYGRQGYVEAGSLDEYYAGGTHGLRLVKHLKAKSSVASRSS